MQQSMKQHELLKIIPMDQLEEVFSSCLCELDADFLGFTEIYKKLSEVIPHHFTVIDLGCNCAAQSFYFLSHARYIGVDVHEGKRFGAHNTIHHVMSIQRFVLEQAQYFDLDRTFAICSYVPDEEARAMVRASFPNLFVYYPSGYPVVLRQKPMGNLAMYYLEVC